MSRAPALLTLVALAAASSSSSVHAWPKFMSSVPNGANVLFNKVDLGHAEGNMLRNAFGLAFNVPRNWTTELCEADSDGDGQTNGQELGDPCCVWTVGNDAVLQRTTELSNPGNKSSTTDASLWKNVDCQAARQNATAPAAAPAAATSSAAALLPAGVAATLLGAALVALN